MSGDLLPEYPPPFPPDLEEPCARCRCILAALVCLGAVCALALLFRGAPSL